MAHALPPGGGGRDPRDVEADVAGAMILIPIRTRGSNAREHWQQRHRRVKGELQGTLLQ